MSGFHLIISVLLISAVGMVQEVDHGQASPAGGCGSGGSCCVAGGVGCNDVVCCTTVCAEDPFCCESDWDDLCAKSAASLCGDLCSGSMCPGAGDCCAAHSGVGCEDETCCGAVCDARPSCCTSVWDIRCVIEAGKLCDQCPPVVLCPGPGDCCSGHAPDAGCERTACCEYICELDDYCCITEWDSVCANRARQLCNNVCVCDIFGDFDASGGIDLLDFAAMQRCFTSSSGAYLGPGCECADYDGDDYSDLSDFAYFGL